MLSILCLSLSASAQEIVISEIHYHPLADPPPTGETNTIDGDEFEFLEIENVGPTPYDLEGAAFVNGVEYRFASSLVLDPGEYVIVVENEEYFTSRYPDAANVAAGQYGGKLSNGGERIALEDSSGTVLFAVEYNDKGDWPAGTDGDGRSLMLTNPGGAPNNPANWSSSAELHGSPGTAGVARFQDILLNEVLAHSDPPLEDAVELHNLTAGEIDLNGWYLSDDFIRPKKYRLTNTVSAADSYTVVYEYQFNPNALFNTNNTPFALSSYGDEVILTAPFPNSDHLRLVDNLDFGATRTDFSIGRFPNGTGPFMSLETLTFGTTNPPTVDLFREGEGGPNSIPLHGPIVINEIMYHPCQTNEGAFQYVELFNASDHAVDISGWYLDGASYTNPPGTSLQPGDYLAVCADQTQIRSAYGITNTIGNMRGDLDNGGERLVLRNEEGAAIDEADYNDKEPWPVAADGYGPSLERIRATDEGDSFVNWGASRGEKNWQPDLSKW